MTYGTPEPCYCGATDCKRCFPLTWNQREDEDDDEENEQDDQE